MSQNASSVVETVSGRTGPHSSARPRIGLALGGGAARGWAHIGVLRELTTAGLVPDVVVGTSIGAVVGACFAAGRLAEVEAFARGLNRRRVFGLIDLSFAGTGLIGGARLKRRLERDLGGLRFEDLPIRFATIATEVGSGREVCLSEGNLVDAIRASYAMPGIFEPQKVAGRLLFDGAMANPVPVSVCRSFGADVVVAVSLTAERAETDSAPEDDATKDPSVLELNGLATKVAVESVGSPKRRLIPRRRLTIRRHLFKRQPKDAPGVAGVLVSAFTVAQERISRCRLAIDPPDVLINAHMTSVGLFDFHRANELIDHGEKVARDALPDIEELLRSESRRKHYSLD